MYYNYVNYIIVIFFCNCYFFTSFSCIVNLSNAYIQVTIDYFDVMYYMHS